MGKHKAWIRRIKEDRLKNKEPLQLYSNPPFKIMHLPSLGLPNTWLRKTKNSEQTELFLIGFRFDTDTEEICGLLNSEFGDIISQIIRVAGYLYEIQLKTRLTWGEIFSRVHIAFDGVVFDVTG